jgi:Glycosyltransferase like family
MIAFGCSITSPEIFERCAMPGIRLAAEPDSKVLAFQAAGSVFRSYNLLLEQAAALDDLEALVLVHQDAEIVDPDFCAKLRRALRDPEVAVVGSVGATGVDNIAWWDGQVTWGAAAYRYGEHGGGEISWSGAAQPPREVDTLYGFILAISPWAVRTIRFDESLSQVLHGYDFDFCRQVRAAGCKVVTEDLAVVHHHSLDLVTKPEPWLAGHMRVAEKWDGGPQDWERRARRAEAEAAAARLLVASKQLQADAATEQHERRLRAVTQSASWRITAPLRRLNGLRARTVRRSPGRSAMSGGA